MQPRNSDCRCRPARTHRDCAYCGRGWDAGKICGSCKANGIDGQVIRGTSAVVCARHRAQAQAAAIARLTRPVSPQRLEALALELQPLNERDAGKDPLDLDIPTIEEIEEVDLEEREQPNDCLECGRSYGPRYTGPCEH